VLECLPLLIPHGFSSESNNVQYGTDDMRYGKMVCTFNSTPSLKAANDVMLAVVFTPLLLALCGMLYYFVRVSLHFRTLRENFQTLQTPLLGTHGPEQLKADTLNRYAVDSRTVLAATREENSSLLDGTAADAHALSVESSGISEAGWGDQVLLEKMSSIAFVLSLYPIALFVCWFPLFVSFVAANGFSHEDASVTAFGQDPAKYVEVISISVASLHGTMLACIFFTHSPKARRLWSHLFQSKCPALYSACCVRCVMCCDIVTNAARGGKAEPSAAMQQQNEAGYNFKVSW